MDMNRSWARMRYTRRNAGHPKHDLDAGIADDLANTLSELFPAIVRFRTVEQKERFSPIITQKIQRNLRNLNLLRHPVLYCDHRTMRTIVYEVFCFKVSNMRGWKGAQHLFSGHTTGCSRIHCTIEVDDQNSRAGRGSLVVVPISLGFGHVPLLRFPTVSTGIAHSKSTLLSRPRRG